MKSVGWGLEAAWARVFSPAAKSLQQAYPGGAIHWVSSLPLWEAWECFHFWETSLLSGKVYFER